LTNLQRLQLHTSELRAKLNDLAGLETLTAEQRAELDAATAAYATAEAQLRAAIVAESDPPEPEAREDAELAAAFDVGRVFEAVLEHRAVDGPERDLQQRYNLEANAIPLAGLAEEARAITPAPANVGAQQAAIAPYVFPSSATAHLGIPRPTVPTGSPVYPTLTTPASPSTPAESATVAETTGAFTADKLSPQRIQASFVYSREDAAVFRGMGAALRENLRDALADGLDKYILTDATVGLFGGGLTAPGNPGARATWASYKAGITGQVDGRYASSPAGLRAVIGPATYEHAAGLYRTNNSEMSATEEINRLTGGGLRVSAHVPAVAAKRQDAIVARAVNARHAVAPVWEGVTLIPDEITKAGEGEIVITAVLMFNAKVIRTDGFARVEAQHA